MGDKTIIFACAKRRSASRCGGFTLLELIVTLAVAAILLGVAVPSYRSVVQRNAVASNVNDLVGDLNYARSEAVTRGQHVFVCSSTDQLKCNGGKDWSRGWVIYAAVDPNAASPAPTSSNRIRVHGATGNGFALTANADKTIGFDANGFAPNPLTFTAQGDDSAQKTQVTVAATGRVETERSGP